jgi:hypothetical protein
MVVLAVSDEFAVGAPLGRGDVAGVGGEDAELEGVEVEEFELVGAVGALGDIEDGGGVRGPDGIVDGDGVGEGALAFAAVFGGGGEELAVGDDGDFFAVRREGQGAEGAFGDVGDAGGGAGAAKLDGNFFGFPEAVSRVQMAKLRSKTMVFPAAPMEGQRTRPSLKWVSSLGLEPETGVDQMFSGPEASDMKKRVRPSWDHMGQACLAGSETSFL